MSRIRQRALTIGLLALLAASRPWAQEYAPLEPPRGGASVNPAEPVPRDWSNQYPPMGNDRAGSNPWQPGGGRAADAPATGMENNPWRAGGDGQTGRSAPQPRAPRSGYRAIAPVAPYGQGANRPPDYGRPPYGAPTYDGSPGYGIPGDYGHPGYPDPAYGPEPYGLPGMGTGLPWVEPYSPWGIPGWGWPGGR